MSETYEIAFQLILAAGDSKSESMNAIKKARAGGFDEANLHVEKAQEALTNAHQIQTDLIQNESRGKSIDINMIVIHAQDHLSMALTTLDSAREMINLYQMIYEIKEK
ncbi:PTS lactose/cellobiose transporter subunit IIA [Breznakia pachnodae]|uniref:PTS system cellobiose-specific IIA component n=1 Tax=Breznakia pachnodae TaxID=265178 RepID=A0ABU0E4H5_9FIRM|nr:PTS lactose/cellobiose transporter subunit IIA [Breznakia pachnodae]MDQ0361799.1 PTS system cellobiose-specific IIA component [Breznakia pachnodae]